MQHNYIFHVHTHRCKHASDENDEKYIERALQLGAKEIIYMDHGPFPENPFNNRMDYEQLPEYVDSILKLKTLYKEKIEINIGLEIEFLPSYLSYYRDLKKEWGIELLIIGQHYYEIKKDQYSFMLKDKSQEHVGLVNAMFQGMDTGMFEVLAHPDRAFRGVKKWIPELNTLSQKIILSAQNNGVYLEKNYRSYVKKNQFRMEFWEQVPENIEVLYGSDAHSSNELILASRIEELL